MGVRKFIGAFLCVIVGFLAMTLPESMQALMAAQAAASEKQAAWDKLADEYFDEVYFKFAPSSGTAAGLHQYDALLEDYSRAGVDANVAALRSFEKRVEAMDPKGLEETRAADRELVLTNIQGTLLALETIRAWEKNPDYYSSGISNSVYVIMIRNFAPADERLRSVVAREEKMPAVVCGGASESEESAADLHRNRTGAAAGHYQFFSERCAGGFCGRDRSGGEGCVCEIEWRGNCGSAELRGVAEVGRAAAFEWGFPHRRGNIFEEIAV